MIQDAKKLIADQSIVRDWLERIGEIDEQSISETLNLMRTNPEYRTFILDYVK